MLGYCAIGSVAMDMTPPSITMMARTQAKMGRSMKKRAMAFSRSVRRAGGCRPGGLRRFGAAPGAGAPLHRFHFHARRGALLAVHHQLVAGREAALHQPLVANGPF